MATDYRVVGQVPCWQVGLVLCCMFWVSNVWSQDGLGHAEAPELETVEASCGVPAWALVPQGLQEPQPQSVEITSEQVFASEAGQISFEGDVTVAFEDFRLYGSNVAFARTRNQLHLDQPFSMLTQQIGLQAEQGYFQVDSNAVELRNLRFANLQGSGTGTAESVQNNQAQTEITDLTYSSCDAENPSWRLVVARATIDRLKQRTQLRHLRLFVGRLPVFYLPYIRMSRGEGPAPGLQSPVFDYQSRIGLSVGLPYQFRLSSTASMTLTPAYLSKRGRQLNMRLDTANSNLSMTWLPRDQDRSLQITRDSVASMVGPSFTPHERWKIALVHEQHKKPWSIEIDIDESSDSQYWRDFRTVRRGQGILASESKVAVGYLRKNLRAQFLTQRFASTVFAKQRVGRLPELDLQWTPSWDWITFSGQANYAQYSRERNGMDFSTNSAQDVQRRYLKQGLTLKRQRASFEMKVDFGIARTWYEFERSSHLPAIEYSQRNQSFSSRLFMDRSLQIGSERWRQTLEPRIYLLNRQFVQTNANPKFDDTQLLFSLDQFFTEQRQSGLDGIHGVRSLSVGLNSSLWQAQNARKVVEGGIAWIHYQKPPLALEKTKNQIGLEGAIHLGGLRLKGQRLFRGTSSAHDESNLTLGLVDSDSLLIELSYAKRPYALTKQTSINVQKQFNAHWLLFAHHTQDAEFDQTIDRFAGLSFENCCFSVKWLYRESIDLDPISMLGERKIDKGFSMQLVFKGLVAVGSSIDNLLKRKAFQGLLF